MPVEGEVLDDESRAIFLVVDEPREDIVEASLSQREMRLGIFRARRDEIRKPPVAGAGIESPSMSAIGSVGSSHVELLAGIGFLCDNVYHRPSAGRRPVNDGSDGPDDVDALDYVGRQCIEDAAGEPGFLAAGATAQSSIPLPRNRDTIK